jgi:putative ABC transport system permease protein
MKALIMGSAIIGVAIAWTPMALGNRSLHVAPLPSVDIATHLTGPVITPSAIRERGIGILGDVNYLLGAGSLIVTVCTLMVFAFVRTSSRTKEILIHRAVGASRKRLVVAGIRESALLALPAMLAGSVLGLSILKFATATWPGSVDHHALLAPFWLPAALGAAIVLGILIPLASVGRMEPARPPLAPLLAPAICALQLAVCFAVMVNARQVGQHAKSLIGNVQEGEDTARVFQLEIPASPAERSQQLATLIRRSGVADLFDVGSLSSPGALEGLGTVNVVITECGACSQGGIATPLRPVPVSLSVVSADTFRALNTQLIEGRWISDQDDWKAQRVAVITQGLARAHFENGNAIGRHIQLGQGPNNRFMVVGVVNDPKPYSLGGALQPPHAVYTSVLQTPPTSVDFLLRPHRGIDWSRVWSWFPTGSVKGALSEKRWRAGSAAPIGWFGGALLFSGGAVVLLALLGIAFAMSLWVGAMLPELAIRRCVGARRRDVLLQVASRSAPVAVAGLLLGLLLAGLTEGPLSSIAVGIVAFDTRGILEIALLTIAVTALGVSVPAWRACKLEPVEVLTKHGE